MYEFIKLFLYFATYSFLGWVCESIYCSILDKKIVNRGFLNGPVCPVYGVGALAVIFLLNKYKGNVLTLFVMGVIVTSIIEYLTSVILEVAFQTRWWDYSNHKFNIHGRVCLLNSILFGIMSVVLVEIIHTEVVKIVTHIPKVINIIVACIIIVVMIADLVTTLMAMINLNSKLKSFVDMIVELNTMNIKFKHLDDSEWKKAINKLKSQNKPQSIIDKFTELQNKFKEKNMKSVLQRRIVKAFPNMKHKKYQEQFKHLKDFTSKKIKNK